jgi:hypothetical protein
VVSDPNIDPEASAGTAICANLLIGPWVLKDSGIVRSDLTFASKIGMKKMRELVPLAALN